MTATADFLTGVMYFAGASAVTYYMGWLFSQAIDDVEQWIRFIRKLLK